MSDENLPFSFSAIAFIETRQRSCQSRTSIKEESVLALTHMSAPIMDEVVNVHKNDEITLFR
ncbi:MAG: hypothetical protein V7K26_16950 [Nostoc sp.]|uniref:hypothetical protein n=1 Tax=Nostoc sp. TaxID=1180 RepID=UPI002FF30FC7